MSEVIPAEVAAAALKAVGAYDPTSANDRKADDIEVTRVGGGSISTAAKVRFGDGRWVFAKWSHSGDLLDAPLAFQAEVDGLDAVREVGSVRVPEVLEVGGEGAGENALGWLILEYVDTQPRNSTTDVNLGKVLADLHSTAGEYFGWPRDNYIGSLPQANNGSGSWCEFVWTQRIEPLLRLCRDRKLSPFEWRREWRELESVLSPLLPDRDFPTPYLLHGDLWSGNVLADEHGYPVLIDPAVYWGDPEVDLAMMELFGEFNRECFESYSEVSKISDAYHHFRRELYQLYPLLVHVILFGDVYAAQLNAALMHTLRA